eukprot:Nitzschia sp. Nitz4//scaffold98_size77359//11224//12076//NITZ4_005536-RA/size77359-augustus-gene-0.59-mRNA-1//-1//CDS//3329560721//7038//frame0
MSSMIVIPDEPQSNLEQDLLTHKYPPEYEGHLESLLISRKQILDRVKSLAKDIQQEYKGRRPVFVCVLKGANPFYQHLLDALMDVQQGFYMEFIRISSYDGLATSGNLQVGKELSLKALEGKDVILVEDIIDTGTTLSEFVPTLQKAVPSIQSLEVVTLLSKRLPHPAKYSAKYVGFSVPNHFIIGYGLDYNELYRDLMDIWVISKKGVEFKAESFHTTTSA